MIDLTEFTPQEVDEVASIVRGDLLNSQLVELLSNSGRFMARAREYANLRNMRETDVLTVMSVGLYMGIALAQKRKVVQ